MITTRGDIVEDGGIRVQGRVDEADGSLARIGPLFIDEGDDAAKGRRRGRGTVDQAETAVNGDDVIGAVGGHVGIASRGLRIVVLSGGVGRLVVRKVGGDGGGLIRWLGEDVAEATAGVNDRLAGFLGGGHAGAGDDLRRAYRCDVGAMGLTLASLPLHKMRRKSQRLYVPSSREGWVKSTRSARIVGPASTLGLGAALTSVTGNAIVTRRV